MVVVQARLEDRKRLAAGEGAAEVAAGRPRKRGKKEEAYEEHEDDDRNYTVDGMVAYEVETIKDKDTNGDHVMYLVRWKGSQHTDSWEPVLNLKASKDLASSFNKERRGQY